MSVLAGKESSFIAEIAFSADSVFSGMRRLSFLFRKNSCQKETMLANSKTPTYWRHILEKEATFGSACLVNEVVETGSGIESQLVANFIEQNVGYQTAHNKHQRRAMLLGEDPVMSLDTQNISGAISSQTLTMMQCR
ncbi:hypothetical protein TNCV_1162781 [Trichonephila clavipes]|nr:hypothetical protein TNCV_1162781 [Trichonephila clavipes]